MALSGWPLDCTFHCKGGIQKPGSRLVQGCLLFPSCTADVKLDAQGDMLVATTGYTYTREQAYNDVRVRSGEQLVRLNVRNEVRGIRVVTSGYAGQGWGASLLTSCGTLRVEKPCDCARPCAASKPPAT